jgi:hypothetical protein
MSDPQTELERLQSELASRKSITHFAHSAVSFMVSLILAGTSGKLFWDLEEEKQIWAWLVGAVAVAVGGYALTRYLTGRKLLAVELERFEALKALRRTLKLDDPSALLPQ